ncbi:hypothetical protein [Nocardia caishijiensis]|uniref:Tetratricopeptide repeat protein n=1 Tax=Nocardia caishijiensis TaxID=184756 RepID=A0ABQ6YJN1_9NOCA|nr:hypothetical protein [Nocardia caishijiensis]KAF0845853.1 hypothetical protein FNL39_106242 [Nocardia caishijiensis]
MSDRFAAENDDARAEFAVPAALVGPVEPTARVGGSIDEGAADDAEPRVGAPAGQPGASGSAAAEAARLLEPGSLARAARKLARIAAARLIDAPDAAEEQLRRALVVGAAELGSRERAELRTRLVTAIAAQPGRARDVARAAAAAAADWAPISAADSAHLWIVAGRSWHRAGAHTEAARAFDHALLGEAVGYPPGELAQVRAVFAESLNHLGRYRQAAWQFTEAARLIAASPTERHRHADLLWSAAVARECCGQESEALGGYLRAAGLWGEQDKIVPRARCLRAAAWLQLRGPGGTPRGPWWVTLDVLLTELNRLVAADPAVPHVEELRRTRSQFAQMCAQVSGTVEHRPPERGPRPRRADRPRSPEPSDPYEWWRSY